MLHDIVLDERTYSSEGTGQPRRGDNYERLLAVAADTSIPDNQGIALAALGFSGLPEVMPVILQGAQLADPLRRDRAVLGLAVLKDARTPPGVLIQIVEDASYPEDGRAQAAWALYQLQETNLKQDEIIAFWRRLLQDRRPEMPSSVIANAVRGLGLTRKAEHADLVAACTKDQLPRIRMLAAIALARMNATKHWPALVELIGPGESKPNVRLAAQKALVHLAGGQDRGYDVAAWQKLFGDSGDASK
jgi:HEAT repeat protein